MALERAVWLDRRSLGAPLYTPDVKSWQEEEVRGNTRIRRHVMAYKDLRLVSESWDGPSGKGQKKHLASEADLDAYLEFPIEMDAAVLRAGLDQPIARWRQEESEFPKHLGAMMTAQGEPISTIYHMADLAELSIWSITAPHKVDELLKRLMVRSQVIYKQLLEQGVGDVFFMVGSELAAPPMVSRSTFQRWVVPYSRDLTAMVHSYGKKVIQHFHGQIKEILPDFLTMAPDALHVIEAPPIGNCTHTEAFEVLGDKIGLIGNIQYDEFRHLTPTQMDVAVRECLAECRGKRFMLSPTAGPYEEVISDRQRDNYLQFMESGWAYGTPWR